VAKKSWPYFSLFGTISGEGPEAQSNRRFHAFRIKGTVFHENDKRREEEMNADRDSLSAAATEFDFPKAKCSLRNLPINLRLNPIDYEFERTSTLSCAVSARDTRIYV
jgi:hypothetical protein